MATKKRKRRSGSLGGSTEHHAKMATIEMKRARTLAAESLYASEKTRCDDAIADLQNAAVAFGRGQAHGQEAGHHERPELVAARDLMMNARDGIRACFRKKH
jgi:hypothetical protein